MKRTLSVAYKTAWYLCHRIRKALETDPQMKLGGTLEVDESYFGGKAENMHGHVRARKMKEPRKGKSVAVGILERGGSVHITKTNATDRPTIHRLIRSTMGLETERIFTDDFRSYGGIDQTGVQHAVVNHSEREYVRGDVHTNGIENVWSLTKRSIIGSFHHVSDKHLDRYLDEVEFRFNNRENPYLFRDALLRLVSSGNIEYKELVANETAA